MAEPTYRKFSEILAAIAAGANVPEGNPGYPAFTDAELTHYFQWGTDPQQAGSNTLQKMGIDVGRGGAFSNSLQNIVQALAEQSTARSEWAATDTAGRQTGRQLQDAVEAGLRQHQTSFMGGSSALNNFFGNVGSYLKNKSEDNPNPLLNIEPGREALSARLTEGAGADTEAFNWLNDMLRGTISPMLLRSRNMPGLYNRLHNRWSQEGQGSFAEYLLGLFGSGGAV